jgi:hypothetical protein
MPKFHPEDVVRITIEAEWELLIPYKKALLNILADDDGGEVVSVYYDLVEEYKPPLVTVQTAEVKDGDVEFGMKRFQERLEELRHEPPKAEGVKPTPQRP